MELPPYSDSQAQAAAMLNISVYDVKAAKLQGAQPSAAVVVFAARNLLPG